MMEPINLSTGDEMVIGPVDRQTTLRLEVDAGGEPNLIVRDALAYRQAQIERLRGRVAELENERYAAADQIADAVTERLRSMLS